jgi:hypothetical protein
MTPPSSVTSETFDQLSPIQEKPEPFTFRYSSPPEEDLRRDNQRIAGESVVMVASGSIAEGCHPQQ